MGDTAFVTVIPWKTWQTMFGGADDIVGKTVRLNNITRTVVGVLPRDFVMPEGDEDYFYPVSIAPFMRDPISVRGSHNFDMVGRLKPGVTSEAADRELRAIGDELEKLYAKDNLGIGMIGVPLRDSMVGDTRTPLKVLLASGALVLLITCANLAGVAGGVGWYLRHVRHHGGRSRARVRRAHGTRLQPPRRRGAGPPPRRRVDGARSARWSGGGVRRDPARSLAAFCVAAFDPLTLGAAVLVLLLCAGMALVVPVRRATRVDPITVLR